MTRARRTASRDELAAFSGAVDAVLAGARPAESWDLVGFSIDLGVALGRFGAEAPRPTLTCEPRCLLVVRAVIDRERFEGRALRPSLSRFFRRNVAYSAFEAHVVVVEPHRALLRFVTHGRGRPIPMFVTGAIEIVPELRPSAATKKALAALRRRARTGHRASR